jgi:hypothetical protein
MLQNDPLRLRLFHFDADPDPDFHFDADADPEPAFHCKIRIRILMQGPKMMRIRTRNTFGLHLLIKVRFLFLTIKAQ